MAFKIISSFLSFLSSIHKKSTGCSSYAYFPEERVLFTGDELAVGFWPFISDPTGDPVN